MRAVEFITEGQRITLNALYQGDLPDRDEQFWENVRPSELDTSLTIHTMPKHKIQLMLLSQYRAEHLDEILEMLDEEQQEILHQYINDPSLSNKIIVVAGDDIVDGNHRALAAACAGAAIKYVDLSELDDPDEVTEAELDIRGWGGTPHGTDIDYFGLRVQMQPSTFLKLAAPLTTSGENSEVARHMEQGGKIAYPFLDIQEPREWEDGDFSKDARVKSHEGRNRMKKWIQMRGDDSIQVNIFLRGANRRRYITDDMIKQLSRGMFNETGQWVSGPLFDPRTAL